MTATVMLSWPPADKRRVGQRPRDRRRRRAGGQRRDQFGELSVRRHVVPEPVGAQQQPPRAAGTQRLRRGGRAGASAPTQCVIAWSRGSAAACSGVSSPRATLLGPGVVDRELARARRRQPVGAAVADPADATSSRAAAPQTSVQRGSTRPVRVVHGTSSTAPSAAWIAVRSPPQVAAPAADRPPRAASTARRLRRGEPRRRRRSPSEIPSQTTAATPPRRRPRGEGVLVAAVHAPGSLTAAAIARSTSIARLPSRRRSRAVAVVVEPDRGAPHCPQNRGRPSSRTRRAVAAARRRSAQASVCWSYPCPRSHAVGPSTSRIARHAVAARRASSR